MSNMGQSWIYCILEYCSAIEPLIMNYYTYVYCKIFYLIILIKID